MIVTRFVNGQPFMEFWQAFMDFVGDQGDVTDLSPVEEAEFDRIYEIVYMGQIDPVSPEDISVGLRGEAEVRMQLRQSFFAHPRAAG